MLLVLALVFHPLVTAAADFIGEHFLSCMFYDMCGRYCMGCGCTRSVRAILQGDFATAAHNNMAPFVGIAAFLLFYAEKCCEAFGKRLRLLPRKMWFWMTLLALQFIWNIVRNIVPEMAPIDV